MNTWEIWTYDPGYGDHPAIIISHPDRTKNKPMVEFLLASTQRAARQPKGGEVILDSADGLNWETICKCDFIWSDDKTLLHTRRGIVTPARRRAIVSAIIASHGWQLL